MSDIHAEFAAKLFGVPEDAVTPEMRESAKIAQHGMLYGQCLQSLPKSSNFFSAGEAPMEMNFADLEIREILKKEKE